MVDAVKTKSEGMLAKNMSNPESNAQNKRYQRVFDVKRLVGFWGKQRLHLSGRTVLATFSYQCHIKCDCEPDMSRLQYYYYSSALRCHSCSCKDSLGYLTSVKDCGIYVHASNRWPLIALPRLSSRD